MSFFQSWKENKKVKDIFNREILLGGNIGFAFIDGNHTLEYANRDFLNCDKYLDIGGYLLFDDSADDSGYGVCKVVHEIKKMDNYQLIMKNPNYLFKKIK